LNSPERVRIIDTDDADMFHNRILRSARVELMTPGAPRVKSSEWMGIMILRRRAFTLIELLVVVAIIALLISVLLPSLSRARQSTKRVVCASNLRGLMQAVYLYANDHKDRLVTVGLSHGGQVNEHAAWINTLKAHYGGESLIARCPSDESEHWTLPLAKPNGSATTGGPNGEPAKPILRRTSYGTNYYTAGKVGSKGPYDRLSAIKRPTTTILMVELIEVGDFAASDHVHPETWWSNPLPLASRELALKRHPGRVNYSFLDGHVSTHGFDDTYSIDPQRSTIRNIFWKHNYYDPEIAR